MRPVSIIQFERCYLGAIAIGVINSLLLLPATLRTMQASAAAAAFGPAVVYASLGIGLLISLLLWFFAARKASVVAKWIIVVFFAFAVLGLLRGVLTRFAPGLPGVLQIVAFVLQAVAAYLLFRPDSNRWFAGRSDLGETFR